MKTGTIYPRLSALFAGALLLAGCSSTRIERVESDGTRFTARNSRFFWKSTGVDIGYQRQGTNVTAKARLDQTGTDAEAIKAAAEGGAAGAASLFSK